MVEPELEPLLGDGRVTVWVQPSARNAIAIELGKSCFMRSLCLVMAVHHRGPDLLDAWVTPMADKQ